MRFRAQIALSLAALAACLLAVAFSAASFSDTKQNPQTLSAVADWFAPTAEASAIAPTTGTTPGYLKTKATYYVYAKVADSGNPASGIAAVKASVENVTSGQAPVSLVAGSYTVGGIAYNYRSAQLTAGSSTGSKGYTLSLEDKAGNTASQGFAVTILGPFAGAALETANVAGGNEGLMEKGDSVTFTYNNPPAPGSIVAGWTGAAATSVSVTVTQSSNNDRLEISGATALGSVELKGNYVSKTVTFSSSTLALSGNSVVLTLGSPSASGSVEDENSSRAPIWKPSSSAKDLAENAASTASVTAASERQF